MTDEKLTTVCFMATETQKACLEEWAAEDDRSVSYILRAILREECERREAQQQEQTTQKQ